MLPAIEKNKPEQKQIVATLTFPQLYMHLLSSLACCIPSPLADPHFSLRNQLVGEVFSVGK